MIHLNDFVAQWNHIKDSALAAVDRVGASGWLILGEEVDRFENDLSLFWGIPATVGVANGLDAIEISLRTLGINPGDKVLTTSLSAFATTLAIVKAGGVPVFVDTDDRGLIDLSLAEEMLRKDPAIQYMVPVHLFGHPLDLEKLERLRNTYSLKIVEDCAQSIGAIFRHRAVGTVGQLAATSFYPTKNLGCLGDGGAILGTDSDLITRARALRDYGQSKKYVHDFIGLNSRLDELQAAILRSVLLPNLRSQNARRLEIAERYKSLIENPKLKILDCHTDAKSVWHIFPLMVANSRDDFQLYLKQKGISTAVHYPIIIPDQRALESFDIKGEFPNARLIANHEVSIPIHPFLTNYEVDQVIMACNAW